VNRTCDRLLEKAVSANDDTLAEAFAYALGVFYNNTGVNSCYDINRYPPLLEHLLVSVCASHSSSPSPSASSDVPDWGKCCGWDYLHCTEVYLPSGSSGIFPRASYSLASDIAQCQQEFNVTLRPNW
jgi:hypothetical protein